MKKEKVEPKKKNTNDQMARVIMGYAPEPLKTIRIRHTERSEVSLTVRNVLYLNCHFELLILARAKLV